MIRLRWVRGTSLLSKAIMFDTGSLYSHVESVTPDGKYLGALDVGGVAARPNDYDKGGFSAELFVDLPADDDMTNKFYTQSLSHVGEAYDFDAIVGFVSHLNFHKKGAVICSAFQTLRLRQCGWFSFPLSQAAHEISPRDLLLMISARVSINFSQLPDPTLHLDQGLNEARLAASGGAASL